jgi:hypothetical protein
MPDEYRQKIIDWLAPINESEIYQAALNTHEPGTGEWFLRGSTFNHWIKSPESSLWLYGNGIFVA